MHTCIPLDPSGFQVSQDSLAKWDYQPLGREDSRYFVEFFANSYKNEIDDIAFNPWNANIVDLWLTVHYI